MRGKKKKTPKQAKNKNNKKNQQYLQTNKKNQTVLTTSNFTDLPKSISRLSARYNSLLTIQEFKKTKI